MNNTFQPIDTLLKQVELVFGKKPQSPSDFDALAASIFDITHQNIGTSTLKRIWGYVHSNTTPRTSTFDLLSLYVGYADFSSFSNAAANNQIIESNPILGEHIDGRNIPEGRRIKIIWQPDRLCIFRSLGNARFIIEKSQNSKLSVGDTFTCTTFLEGSPLYLTDLMMNDSTHPVSYVCGKENGVKIIP